MEKMSFINLHELLSSLDKRAVMEKYRHLRVNLSNKTAEQSVILRQDDGKPILRRGGLVVIKGKPKQGKTFAAHALLASALGCTSFGMNAEKGETLRVVNIDTMMNRTWTLLYAKRLHRFLGWDDCENNPQFTAFNLLLADVKERMKEIAEIVVSEQCDVVTIDTIDELLYDFNDPEESYSVVTFLSALADITNTCIVCVTYTNKSVDDRNARGHLGSMIEQKSTLTYEVTKKKYDDFDAFLVSPTESRHGRIHDFGFSVGQNGELSPLDSEYLVEQRCEKANKSACCDIKKILEEAGDDGLRRSELARKLMELGHGRTNTYRIIKRAEHPECGEPLIQFVGKMVFLSPSYTMQNKQSAK